ncbi:MAG TPA: hypothetical protein VF862_14305, partial [Gemmatimonadales bacterium]
GRGYTFGDYFAVKSLTQWAIPVAAVVPMGRFTLDAGAWYALTTLERFDAPAKSVSGITDTQVRGSYILGDDAVVLTAMVNLPTGAENLSAAEYAVLAAASSSFFAFPVNGYGSGASVTLGVAGAIEAREWNLGLAGSGRLSRPFTPFEDSEGKFSYQSGPEVRLRAGADRLVGSGRLSLGLTFSTFGDDEFASGGGTTGIYRPGRRLIAEASFATVIGPATVIGYAWDYYRWSGDSAGASVPNRENLLTGGVQARWPLSRIVSWEPGIEGRLSTPEEGRAMLVEFSSGLRIRAGSHLAVIPILRLDVGRLEEPPPGFGHQLLGGSLSVFVRQSF